MDEIARILKKGGVGVLPTDTIYGIVGSALSKKAVARIYTLRRRNPKKAMIILIGSLKDLSRFGITLPFTMKKILLETPTWRIWPGKVSVILPCRSKKFLYLHRGTATLAFRLPAKKSLRDLLMKTGPLVAPSANPEGRRPAQTIREAKKYFKGNVDFYVDGGRLNGTPSKLITIRGTNVATVRK